MCDFPGDGEQTVKGFVRKVVQVHRNSRSNLLWWAQKARAGPVKREAV